MNTLKNKDAKWRGYYIIHFCPTCPEGFSAPDLFSNTSPPKWRSCPSCVAKGVDAEAQYQSRVAHKQHKNEVFIKRGIRKKES